MDNGGRADSSSSAPSGGPASSQASVKSKASASSGGSGAVVAPSVKSRESHNSYSFFSPQQFGRTSLEVLAQYKDIWMLGVTMVIGGQYFHWNEGLSAGFGNFFIASVITAVGYICLCFCIAEMTSILPFSGGAYGFSRVTVNIFGGYIVGCCEAMEYVLYVTASMFVLGKMTSFFLGLPNTYEPLFWLLFYILAVGIQLQGGRFFWRTNAILSVVSVLVICTYCLACIPLMDFNDNASLGGDGPRDPWFRGRDGFGFMHVLPLASWFFVGIEAVPLAGQETHEPKVAMPKGIILCVLTMTLTSLAVVCCSAAVGPSPGDLSETLSPLAYGFSKAFGIAERYVYILVVPAMFATCYGFLFACGRQVWAMAESGLFPNFLRATVPSRGTPYMALVVSSLIGYGFLIITWQHPWMEVVLFHTCITGSYVTYLASFCSFISFRLFYPGLDKKYTYRSPLGLAGACLGILIFTLCIISVAVFQKDEGLSIFFFLGFIVMCSAFYLLYARHNQRFSPMEKSVMMIAHVLKADRIKKKNRPGRLPSKEESEGIISQLREIFKNRWRRDSSESAEKVSGHKRPSSEANVNLDSIVAANVSVNESEPFYDQDRVSAREQTNRGMWSSLRDALAGVTVSAGPAASAAGSDLSGSAVCSVVGVELLVPGSPALTAPSREEGTEERRDSVGSSMWAAIRETLGQGLSAAVTTTPASTAPGTRQHLSPATSMASLDLEGSAVALSGGVFEEPPTGGVLPPKNASVSRQNNLWGSIRGALAGSAGQSKHYVTPNLSREASELVLEDVEAGYVNSLPSSAGIGSPYAPTASPEIDFIRSRGPMGPTPMESYDNSARVSVCSVDDACHNDIRGTPTVGGGESTPRSMFGARILSSLMAIAAGGSAAGSHDSSALSSKCPSIGSAEQREFDIAALTHGMLTPQSDMSEETKRAHVVALHSLGGSARSIGSSGSIWAALRESLSKTLNYTPRQSAAPSLDTSAQSSKYTSMREEVFPPADIESDSTGRPLVRTESLDYSGDRALATSTLAPI